MLLDASNFASGTKYALTLRREPEVRGQLRKKIRWVLPKILQDLTDSQRRPWEYRGWVNILKRMPTKDTRIQEPNRD
jgi:hypothetical protein